MLYADLVPHYRKDVYPLEKVQKRFACMSPGLESTSSKGEVGQARIVFAEKETG